MDLKNNWMCLLITAIIGMLCIVSGMKKGTDSEPTDFQHWETVTMEVTAYCPCEKCCGEYADGVTANGHKIKKGDCFVAAPKSYSFGTKMVIPGYANGKVVEVLDRGGAIKGNKLDVFFPTHQRALEWGRQKNVQVKVGITP